MQNLWIMLITSTWWELPLKIDSQVENESYEGKVHSSALYFALYGLPWWLPDKESASQAGDAVWSLSQEDLLEKEIAPQPSILAEKCHGWRSLVGCSPWGREELDTTERLHFHFSLSCTGEGNGNALQCSCLENPRDGGAWWAADCGVARSRTRLSDSAAAAGLCICVSAPLSTRPALSFPCRVPKSVVYACVFILAH